MISRKNLIKLFDEKIKKKLEVAQSEADTITGLINPFIVFLGYNREEFEEYRREYKAAYLGKKDAVDIALMKGMNNPTVFIECKKYGHTFRKNDIGQLQHYYSAAKKEKCKDLSVGILTDGDLYRIFSETKDANHLDDKAFIEFRLSEIELSQDNVIEFINLLSKSNYDKSQIIDFAYSSIYLNGIYDTLISEFKAPTEEFGRFLIRPLLPDNAKINQKKLESFMPLVFQATQKFTKSLSNSDDLILSDPVVETTDTEVNGYRIVMNLLKDRIDISRLIHEDSPECFYIKIDGEHNKILCSFWFNNESNLMLGLYGKEDQKLKKVSISRVEDIENHKKSLIERLEFLEPVKLVPNKNPVRKVLTHSEGTYEGMSIETVSNNKIVNIPFGKGVFKRKDGRVMEGEWNNFGNFKGQIKKNGKLISITK